MTYPGTILLDQDRGEEQEVLFYYYYNHHPSQSKPQDYLQQHPLSASLYNGFT